MESIIKNSCKTGLKNSFLTVIFALLLSGDLYAQNSPSDASSAGGNEPVNVVLFIADDLGYNDIGPYGNEVVRTPNLDQLAAEGQLFSEAFASSPTCSPSRASIHTGLYPFRNGAHANHTGIDGGVRTLPDYLQDLGYTVSLAGKYHIGPKEAYPFELIHKTNVPEPGHEDDGVLWTDLNMDPVDEWLGDQSEKEEPFMLVVNDHSPHVIWPEDPEYDGSNVDIPSQHIDTEATRESRSRYYADITKMDGNVGELMESLNNHDLAENTVIIFTADQGPQWAFGKWSLYDYGIQVPLIVRWPGVVEEGTDSDALVSLVDLLPTAMELAGGEAPEGVDGESFLPVLTSEQNAHHDQVYASHTGDSNMNRTPMRMIRTKRYKYIRNLAPDVRYTTHMDIKKRDPYWDSWLKKSFTDEHAASVLWRYHNRPEEELYDVQADPQETRNLAQSPHYKDVLEEFRAEMEQWRDRQGDSETGPYDPPERDGDGPVAPYIFK